MELISTCLSLGFLLKVFDLIVQRLDRFLFKKLFSDHQIVSLHARGAGFDFHQINLEFCTQSCDQADRFK